MYKQSEAIKILLKEKVKIFAKKGFEDYINRHSVNRKFLIVQKTFKRNSIFCKVAEPDGNDAFYIVSDSTKDLYYIAFILNSGMAKFEFSERNAAHLSGTVNTNKLKNFTLVDIPDEYKNPCNELDLLIGNLDQYVKKGDEVQYLEFVCSFMNDLRDAIVSEIYLQPLFDKYNVHILDRWVDEYKRIHEGDVSDWNTYLTSLFDSLFSPNNQLLEGMKKFRMLINDSAFTDNDKL